jgi:hypothetical protein
MLPLYWERLYNHIMEGVEVKLNIKVLKPGVVTPPVIPSACEAKVGGL